MNVFWTPEDRNVLKASSFPYLPTLEGSLLVYPSKPDKMIVRRADTESIREAIRILNNCSARAFCEVICQNQTNWEKPVIMLAEMGRLSGVALEEYGFFNLGFVSIVATQKIIEIARTPARMHYKEAKGCTTGKYCHNTS